MESVLVDQIEQVAVNVDDYLVELLKTVPNPLVMSTIVLSRLMLANDYAGSGAEFRSLMKEVADNHYAKAEELH